MIDESLPVNGMVLPRVLPGEGIKGSSGSPLPRGALEVKGRILNVRRGRLRGRRCSPLPYGGVNRRGNKNLRRSSRYVDNVGDRVVTILVPAGEVFDRLVGAEVRLRPAD